jgi:hypothetical protein
VSGSCAPATTFLIKDVGAPGRGEKLFKVKKGKLLKYGYSSHLPAATRRTALRKADKAYGSVKLWRMLNAQVLFRKRAGDDAKNVFLADREWVRENLINTKEARSMTKPAVSAWKRMPHYKRVLARAM